MENINELINNKLSHVKQEYDNRKKEITSLFDNRKKELEALHNKAKTSIEENENLSNKEKSIMLKENERQLNEKIATLANDQKRQIGNIEEQIRKEKNTILSQVCDELKKDCDKKYEMKKVEIEKRIQELEDEVSKIDVGIDKVKYDSSLQEIENNYKTSVEQLKENLSSKDTKKFKKRYFIIPEEKREEIAKYILSGYCPVSEIDDLEIAEAYETAEKVKLSELKKEKENKRIELEKTYKEDLNNKHNSIDALNKSIKLLNEELKNIKTSYDKQVSELDNLIKVFNVSNIER